MSALLANFASYETHISLFHTIDITALRRTIHLIMQRLGAGPWRDTPHRTRLHGSQQRLELQRHHRLQRNQGRRAHSHRAQRRTHPRVHHHTLHHPASGGNRLQRQRDRATQIFRRTLITIHPTDAPSHRRHQVHSTRRRLRTHPMEPRHRMD